MGLGIPPPSTNPYPLNNCSHVKLVKNNTFKLYLIKNCTINKFGKGKEVTTSRLAPLL